MKSNHTITVGRFVCTAALALSSTVWALAADTSAKSTGDSRKAARLFQDIKADAIQVRAAAAHLDELAGSPRATWLEYDRQWNEIKPSVERMQIQLAHLDAMQAAMSPAERKDLDQCKLLIDEIQSRTHQLRALLDNPGAHAGDAKFKTCARRLKSESVKLEKAVTIG